MPEPDPPPPSARASSLRALVARLRPQPGWADRAMHGLLLVVVSVAAAFVIYPGLYEQQIPDIRGQDVGQPFRASSPAGFKAARDYEIINHAMTEQRRQQALAAVRPVYDLNPFLLVELRQAIRDSFATMRGILAEQEAAAERAAHPDEPPERVPARRRKGPVVEPPDFQKRLQEGRQELEQKLFGRSDLPLEDEDFQELLAAKFSPEVEQAVLSLLERAYAAPVAGSREELSREGADGISVRDLRDLQEQPRVASAPSVLDVREVQGELDRFASVPGSLLPDRPAPLRRAVLRLARRQIRPNLTINTAETGARRRRAAEEVKDAVIQIKKGQKVIGDGDLINETHLVIISGMRAQTHELDLTQLRLGGTGLVALLLAACFAFHRAAFRRFRPTRKDALLLGGLLVTMLALLRLSVSIADAVRDRYEAVPATALYYCIPVAAGAMLVRFILTEEMTLFFAIVSSCLAGVLLGNSLAFGIYTLIGSLVAADRISKAKDRVGIFRAGLFTGVANLLTVLFVALVEAKGLLSSQTLIPALFAFVGTSLFVPTLVMAITPLVEAGFGYASDIKLLELANLNHPALKELIVQAPGTYHHSIILGTLVENAAEAIGANPLLARSCAYYHDIGKGRNPLYFGENQKGENRHDALAPAMSALIVKRHVTEGMEMARHYRLPRRVADAIPQHHGTRLVGYFFHKALKEQEGKENPPPMDESTYRYPGPKPQFREAALVMIADAVEASTRSMSEPSSPKLQAQVQKIINLIFAEGQLDECDLTLKDLNLIAQSFLHTLEGIYHARPVYPPGAVGGGRPAPAGTEPIRTAALQVAGSKPAEAVNPDVRRGTGG